MATVFEIFIAASPAHLAERIAERRNDHGVRCDHRLETVRGVHRPAAGRLDRTGREPAEHDLIREVEVVEDLERHPDLHRQRPPESEHGHTMATSTRDGHGKNLPQIVIPATHA